MNRAADLHRSTRRFVAYVHWSMYLILLAELWIVLQLGVHTQISGPPLVGAMLLVVVHTAAGVGWLRWSLRTVRSAAPLVRRGRYLLAPYLLLTVATCLVIPLTTGLAAPWPLMIISTVALSTSAFAPRLPWWLVPTVPAVVAAGLLLAIVPISGMTLGQTIVSTAVAVAFAAFVAATFWLSGWMLRVMYALDDARGQSAQLAIAEERLRISRDLHDVFGRTLATVAVKSELAAELARRGRSDRAAEEMAQVRRVSDEAGREVRRIVAGVRDSDLARELVGSRSLLASAGVECQVANRLPDGLVGAEVGAVLGAVVREAVTNVIRHSQARTARITVDVVEDGGDRRVRLQVSNDGAREESGTGGGHGLVGMAERLDAVGGSLHRHRDGATFTLGVDVPLAVSHGADRSRPGGSPPFQDDPDGPDRTGTAGGREEAVMGEGRGDLEGSQ